MGGPHPLRQFEVPRDVVTFLVGDLIGRLHRQRRLLYRT